MKKNIKLSYRQVEAIEYLQKNGRAFVTYNSYLHTSTVRFLIKNKIAKMEGNYLVLLPKFNKSIERVD